MKPRNTMNAAYKNNYLYDELVKYGELKDSRERFKPQQGFRRKAKSDETKAREGQERRYVRRSRVCPECFELRSMSGDCRCTE